MITFYSGDGRTDIYKNVIKYNIKDKNLEFEHEKHVGYDSKNQEIYTRNKVIICGNERSSFIFEESKN